MSLPNIRILLARVYATQIMTNPIETKSDQEKLMRDPPVVGVAPFSCEAWLISLFWKIMEQMKSVYYLQSTSLAGGRCGSNFKSIILNVIKSFSSLVTYCEIVLMWIPQNLTIEKSTLVQVMVRCRQDTSHCMTQCGYIFMSSYMASLGQIEFIWGTVVTNGDDNTLGGKQQP